MRCRECGAFETSPDEDLNVPADIYEKCHENKKHRINLIQYNGHSGYFFGDDTFVKFFDPPTFTTFEILSLEGYFVIKNVILNFFQKKYSRPSDVFFTGVIKYGFIVGKE